MQSLQNNFVHVSHSTGDITKSKQIAHCKVGEIGVLFDINF